MTNETYYKMMKCAEIVCNKVIPFAMVLLIGAILILVLGSCTTTKYVPVESVRMDSIVRYMMQRDSIHIKDSIYIYETPETKVEKHWNTMYIDRWRTDTTYIERTDSVPVPYPVERKLTKWERTKIDYGGYAMCGFLLMAMIIVWWLKTKGRK